MYIYIYIYREREIYIERERDTHEICIHSAPGAALGGPAKPSGCSPWMASIFSRMPIFGGCRRTGVCAQTTLPLSRF